MSREHWYAGKVTKEETSWDNLAKKPLTQKTDDPEAKNYDEATDIFLSGVSQACSEWRF